jgi:hypothetical protein
MWEFNDVYGAFTEFLNDHNEPYEAGKVNDALDGLSDDELQELGDFLDDNPTYDEFADWCEEHDIRYH